MSPSPAVMSWTWACTPVHFVTRLALSAKLASTSVRWRRQRTGARPPRTAAAAVEGTASPPCQPAILPPAGRLHSRRCVDSRGRRPLTPRHGHSRGTFERRHSGKLVTGHWSLVTGHIPLDNYTTPPRHHRSYRACQLRWMEGLTAVRFESYLDNIPPARLRVASAATASLCGGAVVALHQRTTPPRP